jgi:hypothetical protein
MNLTFMHTVLIAGSQGGENSYHGLLMTPYILALHNLDADRTTK